MTGVQTCALPILHSKTNYYLGMSLVEVESDLNKYPVGGRKDLIRYWCNGFKLNSCNLNCASCQAIVFNPPNTIVFINGTGSPPKITRIEDSVSKKYNYLVFDHNINYDIALALYDEKIIRGMTLDQARESKPTSQFDEKYWCNLKK